MRMRQMFYLGILCAIAATAAEYELWVNGEQVTDNKLSIACGNGTASFNPSTSTLTLDNATITSGADIASTYSGILVYLDSLNIVLIGKNYIT